MTNLPYYEAALASRTIAKSDAASALAFDTEMKRREDEELSRYSPRARRRIRKARQERRIWETYLFAAPEYIKAKYKGY